MPVGDPTEAEIEREWAALQRTRAVLDASDVAVMTCSLP
jgi:hypothetical protein